MKTNLFFNWSTGKDSALALYLLLQDPKIAVKHLLTTVNSDYDRVSMHGLRRTLMEQQLTAIGIPYSTVELPQSPTMEMYSKAMSEAVKQLQQKGLHATAFGDIFLEDLRAYREDNLHPLGIKTYFPLWKKDTRTISQQFFELGFKAITVCCKSDLLDESFVGREYDQSFINDLPKNVDPCGENGEFHTFCYAGPIFKSPLQFSIGEKVKRGYATAEKCDTSPNQQQSITDFSFWYCDLIPKQNVKKG